MADNKHLTNRLPPQDIEAEKCLIGSLMLDKDAIVKVIENISFPG